jgi:preprotein translocase subunit SecE
LDGAGSLGPGGGSMPRFSGVLRSELNSVAKTTPIEFIRQVQAETKKVVWPSRRETIMTGVMVMIMTTLLAIFFFGIDTLFEAIVKMLLSLAN